MVHSTGVGALGVIVAAIFLHATPRAHQTSTPPLVIDATNVTPDRAMPTQLIVTVRTTGPLPIEAWGVSGEVRYANGATRKIGGGADAYETMSLPESLRPPDSKRMMPAERASLTLTVQSLPSTTPIDATLVPTHAVFEDDTAVGEEPAIELVFRLRRLHQRVWHLADDTLSSALARGATPEQAFAAAVAALEAAGDEVVQSRPLWIIRTSLRGPSTPDKFDQLRTQLATRRAAADRHAERRR